MGLILFLIVGAIAGFLASKLMKGSSDLWVNLLLGVIGAVVRKFLAGILGLAATGIIGQIIIATLGAVVCLAAWRAYKKR
ncbi:MAG: GlsB/YeaQ/YmgE family stress response membrane protein [Alphaproteobacteria bacterium]